MFKKDCFLENVFYLAKKKNLKINDIESAIGVSAGYLSKLRYDESRKNINADIMFGIAEYLKTSVDYLNNTDCNKLNDDEIIVSSFFEKILLDTIEGVCQWEREPEAMLNDNRGHIANALTGSDRKWEIEYHSKFDLPYQVDYAGDSYVLEIKMNAYLAMVRLKDTETQKIVIETYLLFENGDKTEVDKLCIYKENEPSELDSVIINLYEAAENSGNRLSLDYSTSKFLIDYLGESDEYHYKNLPF